MLLDDFKVESRGRSQRDGFKRMLSVNTRMFSSTFCATTMKLTIFGNSIFQSSSPPSIAHNVPVIDFDNALIGNENVMLTLCKRPSDSHVR